MEVAKNEKGNSMRFIKCFVVMGLCFFMGACWFWKGTLDIDIGDYENQLNAWNSQNMLDYQLDMWSGNASYRVAALITVKNGIPVSSDPSYWLEYDLSSIPECYSFIKIIEKEITDEHKSGSSTSYSLKVTYNTEYHYPSYITMNLSDGNTRWSIALMPLEEGELEIDIGDYENQLAAWNSQNMLDYKLAVTGYHGKYNYSTIRVTETYNVKNGIPDITSFFGVNITTIPTIYSYIKEEEERIRNAYNGINRSYLNVQYDTEYHYPTQISSGVDHQFGSYKRWKITITPPEKTGSSEE